MAEFEDKNKQAIDTGSLDRSLGSNLFGVVLKDDQVTEESWLTVSDWVTFLSNEKHGTFAYFGAFASGGVAAIAVAYSMATTWVDRKIGIWVAIPFAFWVSYMLGQWWKQHGKKASRAATILDDIMKGDLDTVEKIHDAWNLPKQPEGKHGCTQDQLMSSVFSWGKALGSAVLAPIVFVLGFLVGLCEPFKCIGKWVKPPPSKEQGPTEKTKT